MSRKYTTLPYTELTVADGNFDTSRLTITNIVLHTMVGTWQSAAARFAQYGTQVSAHYGVKYSGGLIAFLEEYYTGYHSGSYSMNQRSIGIEHEDMGQYNSPRPDVLYETSAKLVAEICKYYGIPCDRQHILDHRNVIPTQCPDSLDTNRIIARAQQILATSGTDWKAKCDTLRIATDRLDKELISDLSATNPNYQSVYNATTAKAQKIATTGTL